MKVCLLQEEEKKKNPEQLSVFTRTAVQLGKKARATVGCFLNKIGVSANEKKQKTASDCPTDMLKCVGTRRWQRRDLGVSPENLSVVVINRQDFTIFESFRKIVRQLL